MNIDIRTKRNRLIALLLALTIIVGFYPVRVLQVSAAAAVTSASINYSSYNYSEDVEGLTITFYSDIYSRGFCWFTSADNMQTELYIVSGGLGQNASFNESNKVPESNCSAESCNDSGASKTYVSHKAHVTGLTPGETYSYKVGGNGHYKYGTFKVEGSDISQIDIISLTDAQTRNLSLLSIWENSVVQSIDVVKNPDFVLYNGDQFDVSGRVDNSRVLAYGLALDVATSRLGSIPYMASLGNHDYSTSNTRADIDYANTSDPGYYSFDYGFAHFVVLNVNGNADTTARINAQLSWVATDLAAARSNSSIKWIVVMMHNGPHSTGDHSADIYTPKGAAMFTEIFSTYHVDLVIQGHDHTYSKTLPYKWDTAGKTTTYGNTSIVNYNVITETVNGVTYDINPNGTYYVTTGAAGHRAGATAGEADGVYADVYVDQNAADGSGLAPVNPSKTYLNNQYKTIVGTCNVGGSIGTSTVNKGDPSTANIDGQMFGSLSITPTTLSYKFYTVDGSNVNLLDTLDVMKVSGDEAAVMGVEPGAENASAIKDLLCTYIDDIGSMSSLAVTRLRTLINSIASVLESEREALIDSANSSSSSTIQLQSVQSSEAKNNKFNLRLVAGTKETNENVPTVGFYVYKDTGSGFGEKNTFKCSGVYTSKVDADAGKGFANEKTVAAMNGGNLFALTIKDIAATGSVRLKVQPFGIDQSSNAITGNAFIIELQDGFIKSVTAG